MNQIRSMKFPANEMNALVLQGCQKPLHHKEQKYPKEELQLAFYRRTYEMLKNYKENYINSALRKIRLTNLSNFVKTERNKTKNKVKSINPNLKIKTNTDLIREQWQEARNIGNEFSTMNKYCNFEPPTRWEYKTKDVKKIKEKNIRKARDYGNICSFLNVTKFSMTPVRSNRVITHRAKLMEKRQNIWEYGSYYSMRNKLYLKDSFGEFDNEYQELLEKCVTFERSHLNVCGFLEEMLHNSLSSEQKKIAAMRKKYKKQNTFVPKETKINKPILKDRTKKKLHATVAVQANFNEESIGPNQKKFSLDAKISMSMPDIHLSECPANIINIMNAECNSNLPSKTSIGKAEPQKDENISITKKLFENVFSLSDAAVIGQSFEEAVLDLTKGCVSEDVQSTKMSQIISDLFLAFGLNLVKSVVGKDSIMEDIQTNAVKDKVTEQANPMLVSVK